MTSLTRRQTIAGLATAGAAAVFAPAIALAQAKELRMYTWDGYADDAWIKEFEAAHGCKVNAVYAGSVDEMFAKMSASKGADFDIVAVDTSSVPRYVEGNLLQPLDLAKLPLLGNLTPAFKDIPVLKKDGGVLGVPFAWGSLGMIYDASVFKGKEPDSWSVLWDPEFEGRMLALDDANNSIVTAALYLGFPDPYNLSAEQFDQVKAKLIEQKRLLLSYYTGFDEGVEIWKKNRIAAMFSMGESQLKKMVDQGLPVAYLIPKEKAVGWLDCLLLSAGSRNLDLAHAWIDFCLDKKIGAELTAKFSYGNTTGDVPGMDYADKLSWLQPPEDFNKRVNVWNEVKAAI